MYTEKIKPSILFWMQHTYQFSPYGLGNLNEGKEVKALIILCRKESVVECCELDVRDGRKHKATAALGAGANLPHNLHEILCNNVKHGSEIPWLLSSSTSDRTEGGGSFNCAHPFCWSPPCHPNHREVLWPCRAIAKPGTRRLPTWTYLTWSLNCQYANV